jgi:hypothetical protein
MNLKRNYSAYFPVIPAQTGIQRSIDGFYLSEYRDSVGAVAIWIPAFAGMT